MGLRYEPCERFVLRHWSERFLQIEYKDMNCAEFVEHVQRVQFNRDFKFPQSKGSLFLETQQIKEEIPKYVEETKTPKDGDLVLMHGQRLMCHIGVYVRIGWSEYVLHTEGRIKVSSLHRIQDLNLYGYKLARFYRWLK